MLELEQALQQERMRLGALRKKHYELAGVKEEEEEEEEEAHSAAVSYKLKKVNLFYANQKTEILRFGESFCLQHPVSFGDSMHKIVALWCSRQRLLMAEVSLRSDSIQVLCETD